MLFAGWEVCIGKKLCRGLEYSRPRAQFLPIQTDQGRLVILYGIALKITFVLNFD